MCECVCVCVCVLACWRAREGGRRVHTHLHFVQLVHDPFHLNGLLVQGCGCLCANLARLLHDAAAAFQGGVRLVHPLAALIDELLIRLLCTWDKRERRAQREREDGNE